MGDGVYLRGLGCGRVVHGDVVEGSRTVEVAFILSGGSQGWVLDGGLVDLVRLNQPHILRFIYKSHFMLP